MKNIIKTILLFYIVLFNISCKKEIIDDSTLKFPEKIKGNTAIDLWLRNNYETPYNIEVLYKWNASELSTTNTLVPPDEKHIIPVMEIIKKSWIDVYNEMGDPNFIKKHSPKQYLLVGSAEYNSSGGLTTGFAEGGTKIAIFRINWFDLENRTLIKRILKTVHHEYLHILVQKKNYQAEFELVSAQDYTSTFGQLSDAEANQLGFISAYAASGPGEDIAEMVSIMLTEGRQGYENIVAKITNPAAVSKLRAKETLIIDYYKTYWNIDFEKLIEKTQASINQIAPIDFNAFIGTTYNYINLDINDESLWGPEGQQAITLSKAKIKNKDGRRFDYVRLYFSNASFDKVDVQIRFTANDLISSATATYFLKANYNKETNRLSLSNPTASGSNATFVQNEMEPLLSYLTSREFKLKFKNKEPNAQNETIAGLVSAKDTLEYAYGVLENLSLNRLFGNTYKNINLSIYQENLWSGAALTAIRNFKTNMFAGAGQRKFSFIKVNYDENNPSSSTLFGRFLLYNSLNANNFASMNSYQATLTLNLTTIFDKENNILEFKEVTTSNSIYDVVKPGMNYLTNYLTSRKFNLSFQNGTNVLNINGALARLTNTEDASDYIDFPIDPLKLHSMLGEGFYKFQLRDAETTFSGAARDALAQSKTDFETKITWENKGRTLDHYVLNILDNPQAKRAELFIKFTHIGSTASASAQVNFDIAFDKVNNTIKLSNPVAMGSTATNIWPGMKPFLDYLTSTTFKTDFAGGITSYSNGNWRGSLINVNNSNDFITAPLF